MMGPSPVTPSIPSGNSQAKALNQTAPAKGRSGFFRGMTQLFGFRRKSTDRAFKTDNMEFVKVDATSDLRIAQAKAGRVFSTKMTSKLEELYNFWINDTLDSQTSLADRQKRLSEITFALQNDPFLSMAADLYADEATQIDVQGKLIQIDCADIRMKERMEDLLDQWGVTQNRLRSIAHNLASYGDAFWSTKITQHGVSRITPMSIYQIKERLEFNPIQVQEAIALQRGYIASINRNQKMQALFDTLEAEENEEFADLFDTRLFGFVLDDEMVVPPWSIAHFRLNIDQSEYFPMGKSLFLKALAPFRQCNATMVLQSLARVMSFPVTVYNVQTAPGMDEALQFDKINQIREEYENIGDAGAGNEAFSVNTKIWAPKGLLDIDMHSPDIDINATGDIQMYQDRVAIASGVPKGYLVQEWGGFGNSAISLVEQFKPFARRVFTVQSAMLEGISNLFRLHFAITGEYDYREHFVLSMKFPNEESSDARLAAKQNSLNLSKDVLETISKIVGAFNDPLTPEVVQDILSKFSFLDQEDIKKWVKYNPNKMEPKADNPEELGDDGFGGDMGSMMGGDMGGGDLGNLEGDDLGGEDLGGEDLPDNLEFQSEEPASEKTEAYKRMERTLMNEQIRKKDKQLKEASVILSEQIMKEFTRIDETQINNRHYKNARLEPCNEPMYRMFQKTTDNPTGAQSLKEVTTVKEILRESVPDKLNWGKIRESLDKEVENVEADTPDEMPYEGQDEDEVRAKNIKSMLS
jgi:predicted RNA methylase